VKCMNISFLLLDASFCNVLMVAVQIAFFRFLWDTTLAIRGLPDMLELSNLYQIVGDRR